MSTPQTILNKGAHSLDACTGRAIPRRPLPIRTRWPTPVSSSLSQSWSKSYSPSDVVSKVIFCPATSTKRHEFCVLRTRGPNPNVNKFSLSQSKGRACSPSRDWVRPVSLAYSLASLKIALAFFFGVYLLQVVSKMSFWTVHSEIIGRKTCPDLILLQNGGAFFFSSFRKPKW